MTIGNRCIFLMILFMSSVHLYSQITLTEVAEPAIEEVAPYDSTRNFLGNDVQQYIGKKLFVLGRSESLQKYGYDGFYKNNKGAKNRKHNSVFMRGKGDSQFNTRYEALVDQYFIVEEVYPINSDESILKLVHAGNDKVIVYFRYSHKYKHSFPFLTVEYYEKMRSCMIGECYVLRKKALNNTKDIVSGKPVDYVELSVWECIDVTVTKDDFECSAILVCDSTKIAIPIEFLNGESNWQRGYTIDDSIFYINKFGVESWKKILQDLVAIGFTEEMTKMSWGEPKKINRASYGDQWVYGNTYLYFKNGKLTSFN